MLPCFSGGSEVVCEQRQRHALRSRPPPAAVTGSVGAAPGAVLLTRRYSGSGLELQGSVRPPFGVALTDAGRLPGDTCGSANAPRPPDN